MRHRALWPVLSLGLLLGVAHAGDEPKLAELGPPTILPEVGKAELLGPTLTDYNGDGQLDLVLGNYGGQVLLRLNSGSKAAPEFKAQEALKTAQGEIRIKHW